MNENVKLISETLDRALIALQARGKIVEVLLRHVDKDAAREEFKHSINHKWKVQTDMARQIAEFVFAHLE